MTVIMKMMAKISELHIAGQNVSRAVSVLGSKHSDIVRGLVPVGNNQVNILFTNILRNEVITNEIMKYFEKKNTWNYS